MRVTGLDVAGAPAEPGETVTRQFYDARRIHAALALLVFESTPFAVEPTPDGLFAVTLKRNAAGRVNRRIGDL